MSDDDLSTRRTLYPSREQVEALVKALGGLIDRTGAGNEPPGFAEAIAARDWVWVEIFSNWCALEAVLEAIPPTGLRMDVADENVWSFLWWARVVGPVQRVSDLATAVDARWQIPAVSDKARADRGVKSIHLRRFVHRKDGRTHPVLGPDEHAIFVWARGRLIKALEADDDATTPEGIKALVRGVDMGMEMASLVLGGPDEPPVIRGKPWDRPLTDERYRVLKVLLTKFPDRVSLAKLKDLSGAGDAAGILARLSEKPPWDEVIDMAGAKGRGGRGKGYKIKPWSPSPDDPQ